MTKRILVTGATGFIGRHCLPILKRGNDEIYGVTSKDSPSPSNDNPDDIRWVKCDLRSPGSAKELIAAVKPTHLLHLAWDVTPGKFWNSRTNFDWIKASLDLIDAFALHGGERVVIAGSCTEYDWNQSTFCERESEYKPHTLYGASKLSLRVVAESFCKQMGISFAWGHIFYLYGPHEYPERFIPSIIQGLLKQNRVPCSHGNQVRDFLHVHDVASAFCALLDSNVNGCVNIASGKGIQLKEMISKIITRLGGEELVEYGAVESPKTDPISMIARVDRLQNELSWSPYYSLDRGLDEVIQWWKNALLRN